MTWLTLLVWSVAAGCGAAAMSLPLLIAIVTRWRAGMRDHMGGEDGDEATTTTNLTTEHDHEGAPRSWA